MDQRNQPITQVKLARTEAHRIDTEIPISPTNHAALPLVSDAWNKQYHKQSRTDWHSFCTKGGVRPHSHG